MKNFIFILISIFVFSISGYSQESVTVSGLAEGIQWQIIKKAIYESGYKIGKFNPAENTLLTNWIQWKALMVENRGIIKVVLSGRDATLSMVQRSYKTKTGWDDAIGKLSKKNKKKYLQGLADKIIEISAVWLEKIFLSDIEPNSATAGFGHTPKNDKAIKNSPLIIGEKTYSRGIGTHAVSDIEYSLKGFYKKFTAEVGLDAYSLKNKQGSVVFQVFGDDKLLWESGVIKYSDPAKPIDIDISGVDILRLHVGDAGDGIGYDHANWGNAMIGK